MKTLINKFKTDAFFKQGGMVFISSLVVNIFNLVFWLFVVRHLKPEEYALLNALIALLCFATIPLSVVQTVITRYAARAQAQKDKGALWCLVKFFLKRLVFFGAIISLVLIALADQTAQFLRTDNTHYVYFIVVGIMANALSTLSFGVLYGIQQFFVASWDNIAAAALKLFSVILLVRLGFGVMGGLVSFILFALLVLLLTGLQLRPWLRVSRCAPRQLLDHADIYRFFLPAVLSVAGIFALTNMDVILVKHFYSPFEAGIYSQAQIVGKIVLFLPSAFGLVLFTKVADAQARSEDACPLLNKCLGVVGGLGGLAVILTCIMPGLIMRMLTGRVSAEALVLVKPFAFSMSLFSLVNIFAYYFLSLHRMTYALLLLILAFTQFIILWFFVRSLGDVLKVMQLISGILVVLGFWFIRKVPRCEKS